MLFSKKCESYKFVGVSIIGRSIDLLKEAQVCNKLLVAEDMIAHVGVSCILL